MIAETSPPRRFSTARNSAADVGMSAGPVRYFTAAKNRLGRITG
jgi:hypothetical protein